MFLSLGAACCYVSWNFRQTAVAVAKSQDGGWLMKPDKVQSSPTQNTLNLLHFNYFIY